MLEELAALAHRAIDEKIFPGCAIGVIKGGSGSLVSFGRLTYEQDPPEVWEGTIYDLASVTKSIPVASLAALMIAEGKLRLDDTVLRYIPKLQNDHGATIEDLLRYRVRGPRMSTLGFRTFEQVRTHMLETGFAGPPGESEYSNGAAFFLGITLERAGGMILPALAHKYLFGPLGMKDTTFFPYDTERIAPTEIVAGEEIRGIVHDESARLFAARRRAVGHAGLFSTAHDLLIFCDALLRGTFPAITEAAQEGLGWQREGDLLGMHASGRTFGKTGFTGTSVAIDPEKKSAVVLLSNRTYPKRPLDSSAINAIRRGIADIVFSAN